MKKILTFDSTICQGFVRSSADQKPLASEDVFLCATTSMIKIKQ